MISTNVTLPRDLVEKAIDAIEDSGYGYLIVEAMQAALEQPNIGIVKSVPPGWYESIPELAAIYGEMCAINETPRKDQTAVQTERLKTLRAECVEIHHKRIMLAAAPQPPTDKESLTVESKPQFSAHDDAERLKSVARGMSYNDHGEAVWKHTLMEIAVRLETGGYAAPKSPVVERPHVGKELDWKDLYQKEKRRAEMWIAKYEQDIGKLERAVPAAQQPQGEQEPVAWMIEFSDGRHFIFRMKEPPLTTVGEKITPPYTHSQNLSCKSNQSRLATLRGYEKPQQPVMADREGVAEKALEEILSIILGYLPPDGPDAKSTLSKIISVIDPWPLKTPPKQKHQQD